MSERPESSLQQSLTWFLRAGLLLGFVYGLIEACVALMLTHWRGSLTWKSGTSLQALLYTPLIYGIAYLILALLAAIGSRVAGRFKWDTILIGLLAGLSGYLMAVLLGQWFSRFAAVMIGLGLGTVAARWYNGSRSTGAGWVRRLAPGVIAVVVAIGLLSQWVGSLIEERAVARLPRPADDPPNVIIVVLDTERGDHLTPYGYERPTTPVLNKMAQEGTVYEWAMSPAPTTLPSHSSMMTGRRVAEHRAGMGRRFLDDRYPTLAEVLRDRGYATAGFVANIYWAGRHTGLSRGFAHYEDFYGTTFDGITRTILGHSLAYWLLPKLGFVNIPGRKSATVVNREFLNWLDDAPADRPYFVFLNYLDVHAPYLPPREYQGRFSTTSRYRATRIEIGAWSEHDRLPDANVLQEWRDRYDESLLYLDHELGSLFDDLKQRGRLDNTIVIVTADHGESFGEHGTIHHGGSLHLEQVRVPLLLWGPGIIPVQRRSEPVDLRSIPATVTQTAGISDSPFPGRSILDSVKGLDSIPMALSEGQQAPGNPDWQTGRGWVTSLIQLPWHVMALESGDHEVYNILKDPKELHDVSELPEGVAIVKRLQSVLRAAQPPSRGRGAAQEN